MMRRVAYSLASAMLMAGVLAPVAQAAEESVPPPCPPEPIIQSQNGQLELVIPVPGPGCNHLVVPVPVTTTSPLPV